MIQPSVSGTVTVVYERGPVEYFPVALDQVPLHTMPLRTATLWDIAGSYRWGVFEKARSGRRRPFGK